MTASHPRGVGGRGGALGSGQVWGPRGKAFLTGRYGFRGWDSTDSPRKEVCLRSAHGPRLPRVPPCPLPRLSPHQPH